MTVATLLTLATAMSAARRFFGAGVGDVSTRSTEVSRIIVGGALLTIGMLALEQARPREARGLATVIFTTSVLVNGVGFFELTNAAIGGKPIGSTSTTKPD